MLTKVTATLVALGTSCQWAVGAAPLSAVPMARRRATSGCNDNDDCQDGYFCYNSEGEAQCESCDEVDGDSCDYDFDQDSEASALANCQAQCEGPTPTPVPTISSAPTMTPVPTHDCPHTLTESGKCLFVSANYHTFKECESEVCAEAGAALVCISNSDENAEVFNLLAHDTGGWIGYNDGASEGEWRWNRDTCKSDFQKFAYDQPDDYCWGENCAHIGGYDWLNEGEWNDQSCTSHLKCICEYGEVAVGAFDDWDPDHDATDYGDECEDWWEDEDDWWASDEARLIVAVFVIDWCLIAVGTLVTVAISCMRPARAGEDTSAGCCNQGLTTTSEKNAHRWCIWALVMECITLIFSLHPFDLFGVFTGLIGIVGTSSALCRCACGNTIAFMIAAVCSIITAVFRAIGIAFWIFMINTFWHFMPGWITLLFISNLMIGIAVNATVAFFCFRGGCCDKTHVAPQNASVHVQGAQMGQMTVVTGAVVVGAQAPPSGTPLVQAIEMTPVPSTPQNQAKHAAL